MKIDKQYPQLKSGDFKGTYFGKYKFKEVVDGHVVYEIASPETISFPAEMIPPALVKMSGISIEKQSVWKFLFDPERRKQFSEKEAARFTAELEPLYPDYFESMRKGEVPPMPQLQPMYAQHLNLSCNPEQTIYYYQLLSN